MTGLPRRGFLAATAAAVACPRVALAAPVVLRAEPVTAQILPEGDGTTALLGFNGSAPGPEVRVQQGDRVAVRFENRIDAASALHWHGIRIENAMDGVPGMTQDAVPAGADFVYDFRVPDAGTYWYHAHHRSWEQVARGLYGPLIVTEAEGAPDVDHDITVMIDDWRLERDGTLIEGFGGMHDFAHGGRLGNFARALLSLDSVPQGARLRLRLINTATARIFPIEIAGVKGQVVALDGLPLPAPRDIGDILLAPAQRMDLIVDVTDTVRFDFMTRQGPYELGRIEVSGDRRLRGDPIPALPFAGRPEPDPDARLHVLTLQGGAMGGGHAGDDIWAFNGVSGLPADPLRRLSQGESLRLRLVNDTAFPHGIHLHGHHFFEGDATGDLRDTTLVGAGETRDILCVFDNPGKWLLHCHMLGHQASGMKTWIEVT